MGQLDSAHVQMQMVRAVSCSQSSRLHKIISVFLYWVVRSKLLTCLCRKAALPIPARGSNDPLSIVSKPSPVLDVWGIEAKREVFPIQEFKIKWQASVCSWVDVGERNLFPCTPVYLRTGWARPQDSHQPGACPLPQFIWVSALPSLPIINNR